MESCVWHPLATARGSVTGGSARRRNRGLQFANAFALASNFSVARMHIIRMRRFIKTVPAMVLIGLIVLSTAVAKPQDRPLFRSVADTVLTVWKDYPGATPGRT